MQNSGGCFPPPPGYFDRVREICDEYDVLLVSDEVICAFGRLGHMFGAERYGYQPDMITCAKGITSGYAPLGAMIATDRLMEPFLHGTETFLHGYTFGGHPVSTAVAMANLDIFEKERINEHVRENEGAFRETLEKLKDLPIVGDVRGDGYFFGIELVKDKNTKETFNDEESEKLLRGFLSKALYDAGLYCRADDRGDPVIQLAPPLICDQEHFDEIEQILREVLTKAGTLIDEHRRRHWSRARRRAPEAERAKPGSFRRSMSQQRDRAVSTLPAASGMSRRDRAVSTPRATCRGSLNTYERGPTITSDSASVFGCRLDRRSAGVSPLNARDGVRRGCAPRRRPRSAPTPAASPCRRR